MFEKLKNVETSKKGEKVLKESRKPTTKDIIQEVGNCGIFKKKILENPKSRQMLTE